VIANFEVPRRCFNTSSGSTQRRSWVSPRHYWYSQRNYAGGASGCRRFGISRQSSEVYWLKKPWRQRSRRPSITEPQATSGRYRVEPQISLHKPGRMSTLAPYELQRCRRRGTEFIKRNITLIGEHAEEIKMQVAALFR